jgi:hypothetical protein
MATEQQIQANRRNALRSTGPITPEGKAAVRLNALRHGMRARGILLPGESPEEYHRLCADLESDWQPQNRTEQLLVEQMAVAQWKLARLEVGERGIFERDLPAERQLALLDRFSTYRGRLERSFSGAIHEIEHLRKQRAVPEDRPAPPASDAMGRNATRIKNPAPVAYIMADERGGESAALPPSVVTMSSPAQPDSR